MRPGIELGDILHCFRCGGHALMWLR
jgi:hypothetical protein